MNRPTPVHRRTRLVGAALAAAVLAGPAIATDGDAVVGLTAYPPTVRLDSARDSQRLVVVETLADGRTRDVTDRAAATIADGRLALLAPRPGR